MADAHKTLSDPWADWLTRSRYAGDAQLRQVVDGAVSGFADRVLDGAQLKPGMAIADIGTGTGVLAFRAIERVGPTLRVTLVDTSIALLDLARAEACERQVDSQCAFLNCPAEHLDATPDDSLDAITTRSVLAYVDRPQALREFLRVLKPGGRLSVAEPVFQDEGLALIELRASIERGDTGDPFSRLLHRYRSTMYPDTMEKLRQLPFTSYSERSLFEMVRIAGFDDIHLELHIDLQPSLSLDWETVLDVVPVPWAPTLRKFMTEQLTADERQCFEPAIRAEVESPHSSAIARFLYLNARKPPRPP